MAQRRYLAVVFVPLLLWWIVAPVVNHTSSTSRDVTVKVLAQPFGDGPRLVYRWTGEVYRSCDVTIRRSFIDSQGVVTNLLSLNFDRLPLTELGKLSYEVAVDIPRQIAEGEATYQAIEIAKCDWLQRILPHPVPYPPVVFTVTR